MPTVQIKVERFSLTSSKSFQTVLSALHAAIGHPDIQKFSKNVNEARTASEMENAVQSAVEESGLMEFIRLDHGEVVYKGKPNHPGVVRLIIGNPLIMRQMVERVPDAGSYAPVTILIDERPDGVHLSYDRMASLLASYENEEALKVARDLDAKVEALLASAAA